MPVSKTRATAKPRVTKARQSRPPAKEGPLGNGVARTVQGAVEGVGHEISDTVDFEGGTYKIADTIGIWPMMQFARAAESGVQLGDYRALAALHAFLQDCFAPDEWGRFQEDMIAKKVADPDKLLTLATTVIEKVSSRPTKPPSVSLSEPSAPSDGSKDGSSSPEAAA